MAEYALFFLPMSGIRSRISIKLIITSHDSDDILRSRVQRSRSHFYVSGGRMPARWTGRFAVEYHLP